MGDPLATIVPQVLTICAYTEFAPFAFEREGEIVGTDIALLRRFAHQEGLRVTIGKHPFRNLWQLPGLGACDIAAAGLAALPERNLTAHGVWSDSYATVRRSLLIRRSDAEQLRVPADFRGKKIVATPHSTAEFDARQRYLPHGADLILTVPSQHAVVQALLRQEIAAFAEGSLSNGYLAERYGAGHEDPPLVLADLHETARVETLHFAVRATDPRLVARLNAFVARVVGRASEEDGVGRIPLVPSRRTTHDTGGPMPGTDKAARERRVVRLWLTCLAPPTADRENFLAEFGLQDRHQAIHPGQDHPDGSCSYAIPLTATHDPATGSVRLASPYLHGTPAAPFLYLSLKRREPTPSPWLKRLKIPLPRLPWDQLAAAPAHTTLTARISGAGSGTVPLLDDGWAQQHLPATGE